jgi:hypothetical protein
MFSLHMIYDIYSRTFEKLINWKLELEVFIFLLTVQNSQNNHIISTLVKRKKIMTKSKMLTSSWLNYLKLHCRASTGSCKFIGNRPIHLPASLLTLRSTTQSAQILYFGYKKYQCLMPFSPIPMPHKPTPHKSTRQHNFVTFFKCILNILQ